MKTTKNKECLRRHHTSAKCNISSARNPKQQQTDYRKYLQIQTNQIIILLLKIYVHNLIEMRISHVKSVFSVQRQHPFHSAHKTLITHFIYFICDAHCTHTHTDTHTFQFVMYIHYMQQFS